MSFLCAPRLSWLFFIGMSLALEIARSYGGPHGSVLGIAFFIACVMVDTLVQTHLAQKRREAAEADAHRRDLLEQEAEHDPNVLTRLRHLSEEINAQNAELDSVRLELKIAVAEKQQAVEEREDIRQVLNFNRTQLRAEQLERQDLEEQLAKAGAK